MSVKVTTKALPHGNVPVSDIADVTVRDRVMRLSENIASLSSQLAEAQRAINELQQTTGVASIVTTRDEKIVSKILSDKRIANGAEVNVQSDWNITNDKLDSYIKNKPTIPAAQVNSDWNATSGVARILNKPTIPAAQVNSDWNATSGVAQILNKPTALKNPNALTINNTSYDGSQAQTITVMPYPSGGSNGYVLTKNSNSAKWTQLAVGNTIAAKSFSYTSGAMSQSTPAETTTNVALSGYTPIAVCNVACEGTNTSVYDAYRAVVCTNCTLSGNSVTIKLRGTWFPGYASQTAQVTFTVLYSKN